MSWDEVMGLEDRVIATYMQVLDDQAEAMEASRGRL
jgi:septum formation inhibitor-activating ATPase MinD